MHTFSNKTLLTDLQQPTLPFYGLFRITLVIIQNMTDFNYCDICLCYD